MTISPIEITSMRFLHSARWMLAGALCLIAAMVSSAQTAIDSAGPWTVLDRVPPGEAVTEAWVRPVRGLALSLDFPAMTALLAKAPLEFTPRAITEPLIIAIPDPDGHWQRFKVVEYSVMEAPLAAAHPEIRDYRGEGIDDVYANIRCSLTPLGFQAQVRTSNDRGPYGGMWHVDAYTRGNFSLHMSYWHADAGPNPRSLNCLTTDNAGAIQAAPFQSRSVSGPTLRQYRLALAVTGETTVWAGGPAPAFTLVTNIVNQLDGIYEPELTVRLVLVAGEPSIIYPDPASDPFAAPTNASATNNSLQAALDATILNGNYDVGHVIHYGTSNNGLAGGIGTICIAGSKGAGYSAYTNPNDAFFVIDYVSHELGHQFGGHHVHTNCNGSAGDSAVYLVEPGSGSTIMSYAGICGAVDNVQAHNDPYFNGLNINQINTYLAGTACAVTSSTGNNAPTVSALASYTIPYKTPFTLTASATDPDGDPITYCWEQQDGASLTTPGTDPGSGPIDRSRGATASPSRTVPQLSTLLAGTTDTWEILPQTARAAMNWRVTVRDNRSGGGGVNQATTAIAVVATGPFQITSPNTAGTFSGPTSVTWAVGGTSAAPINCASVKISLSTDGGNTFPIVLASSAPNTGSATVVLPDINTSAARIKVEAVGNIFFAISSTNFTVVPALPVVRFASGGSVVVSDNAGNDNANGRIDPGENQIRLTIPVTNIGSISATGVSAVLTSNTATASVVSASASYPDMASTAGGINGTPFVVSVSPSHPCGSPISLILSVSCDQGVNGVSGPGTIPISLSTGMASSSNPVTAAYTGASAAITDNNTSGVNFNIPVSGVGTISHAVFRFDGASCSTSSTSTTVGLTHTSVGQLIVKLTSPQGTTVTLIDRMTGGGAAGANTGNNFCNTVLDDTASTSIQTVAASAAPFTGSYSPASPLAAFNGQNANGIWVLNIADVASGTTGTARAFSLVLTPQSFTTCTPPIAPAGACCDAVSGDCGMMTQASCTGAYLGDGAACAPASCSTVLIQVVRTGSGTGSVSSTPAGIACGGAGVCQAQFPISSTVTLTPTPGTNSYFFGWSGAPAAMCPGADPCSFQAITPATITAEFRCRADFNNLGGVSVQDIFDYLNAWFAGSPSADVDGTPGISVDDIFAFLNIWFAGC